MKLLSLISAFLCYVLATTITLPRPVRYEGYKLVSISNITESVLKWLQDWNVDIWEVRESRIVSVFISSETLQALKETGITEIEEITDNVQELIDEETTRLQSSNSQTFRIQDWFHEYHRFDEIRKWYNHLAEKYPQLVTIVPSIGKTHEGRDIFAVKVTSSKAVESKKQIYIQSLQHAREWIGGPTTQYIVHTLLTKYGKDSEVTVLLDQVELLVVPVMNPDGYEYTWTTNRMWRKNRRQDPSGYGVDLNRNWDDHWGQGGSSSDPRSDIYKGPSAASEPEVKAIEKFFLANKQIIAAIDYHSFSQLVLRPVGWTRKDPKHEKQHKEAGDLISKTIHSVSKERYKNQKSVELYMTTGSASDFWYGEKVAQHFGVHPYSITIELRPANMFSGGFVLHPKFILPTGQENYEAFVKFARFVLDHPLD